MMNKAKCMAKGGKVAPDAAQDKKMISAAIKAEAKKEPVKLVAGGAAKSRLGLPMTKGKK